MVKNSFLSAPPRLCGESLLKQRQLSLRTCDRIEVRLQETQDRVRDRLRQLAARLGEAEWLDGPFNAGDLLMVSVLLRLRTSGILEVYRAGRGRAD